MKFARWIRQEWILVALTLCIAGGVLVFYVQGFGGVFRGFETAFSISSSNVSVTQFQLEEAKNILKTRGIE